MKKIVSMVLVAVMLFVLVSCGGTRFTDVGVKENVGYIVVEPAIPVHGVEIRMHF